LRPTKSLAQRAGEDVADGRQDGAGRGRGRTCR
jgi:hypothetical protein